MQLQQFVSETIRAIIMGIKESQPLAGAEGAYVVPENVNLLNAPGICYDDDGMIIEKIHFDVAVTITEGSSSEGKAGITVWSLGLSKKGQDSASNQSISKIQFSVPIIYPKQKHNSPRRSASC